jgi:hypothetical protein
MHDSHKDCAPDTVLRSIDTDTRSVSYLIDRIREIEGVKAKLGSRTEFLDDRLVRHRVVRQCYSVRVCRRACTKSALHQQIN